MRFIKYLTWGLLLSCIVLGSCVGYSAWKAHLPSDESSIAFFEAHRDELNSIVLAVSREPKIKFVDADWIGRGSDAKDPAHIACSKLLQKVGAKFLRQSDGGIEIYFWGDGCMICHDSYMGFAYSLPSSHFIRMSEMKSSLETAALPRGKHTPVEDGTYTRPIVRNWYLVRWESG